MAATGVAAAKVVRVTEAVLKKVCGVENAAGEHPAATLPVREVLYAHASSCFQAS